MKLSSLIDYHTEYNTFEEILFSRQYIIHNRGFKMHIRFQERRTDILLKKLMDIDDAIRTISTSTARTIRISSSIALSDTEASDIERKINMEVDKVMSVPAASVQGLALRRDLLRRLSRINKYVGYIIIYENSNYFNEINTNKKQALP